MVNKLFSKGIMLLLDLMAIALGSVIAFGLYLSWLHFVGY